jgi:hypothetical protein
MLVVKIGGSKIGFATYKHAVENGQEIFDTITSKRSVSNHPLLLT